MRLLLDLHVLLWFSSEPERIRVPTLQQICSSGNSVFFSAVSFVELSIARAVGRLATDPDALLKLVRGEGFDELSVSARHGMAVGELPRLHRDPFDRLLVAQARVEGLTIVTHDKMLMRYPVATLAA